MTRKVVQILAIAWLSVVNAREWKNFEVIWNVPSGQCNKWWSKAERVENYGVLINKDYGHYGDNVDTVITFYKHNLGLYPYYSNSSDLSSAINGGIPQRVNLLAHLSKVRKDINKGIPKKDFDGLGIIDFEEWRPLWEQNLYTKSIYQNGSLIFVGQRYKNITQALKLIIAEREFNYAAMKFLIVTLREAKRLRPKALWGYYGMPFCSYSAGVDGTVGCGKVYEKFNMKLESFYDEATALYPSIYLPNRNNRSTGHLYVTSVLKEAQRFAWKLNSRKSIFPYTGFEYFPLKFDKPYYTKHDLSTTLDKAYHLGARGVIIWSTSSQMSARCSGMGKYIQKYLGPKVKELKAKPKPTVKAHN